MLVEYTDGSVRNLKSAMPAVLKAKNSVRPLGIRRALRLALLTIGSLMAVLMLAVAIFVGLGRPINLDWSKPQIESLTSDVLQRPVSVEGPLLLTPSFPPAVQIERLRIGNPTGWPEADLVFLRSARAELRLHALLKGELQIGEIDVDGLHVNLETNTDGEPNWLLDTPTSEPLHPATEAADTQQALRFVELAGLVLRDIVIRHHDAETGEDFTLHMAEITGSALDHQPMALRVRGTIQNTPYVLEATAGSLAALLSSDMPWPVEVSAESTGNRLRLSGEIAEPLRGRGLAFDLGLSASNLAEVGALIGTELPAIEPVSVSARLEEQDGEYRAMNVRVEIGTTVAEGSFAASVADELRRLSGKLRIRSIDFGPVLAAVERERTPIGDAKPVDASPDDTPAQASKVDIDLDRSVLQLDLLHGFDAHLAITVDEVLNSPADMRDISMAVDIDNGTLSSATTITLAGVPFHGALALGTEEGQPRLSVELSAERRDIGELASLVTHTESIAGSFETARLDFTSAGESVRDFVENAELRLDLVNAELSYGDESDDQQVGFSLEQANLLFPASDESRITLKGALLGEPFDVTLSGGTFVQNFVERQWPIALEATGSGATLALSGTIRRATADGGGDMTFSVSGQRIGRLATWLGINPDATQPYALSGSATHSLAGLRINVDRAEIGNSAFAGNAGIRRNGDERITFATLDFRMLDLEGLSALAPEAEAPEPKEATELGPEALTIDVPILPNGIEIFDSDIELRIARIKLQRADVTGFSFASNIRDGYVDRAPIVARLGGARFDGSLGIDLRREVPKVRLRIGSNRIDVGTLLGQLGVTDDLSVQADRFALDIALEGASTSEMLRRSTLSAEIDNASWAFAPPGGERTLDIGLPSVRVSARPNQPITLAIDALLEETPATIRIRTDTLGSFAMLKRSLQIGIDMAIVNTRFKLKGSAPLPIRGDNLAFALALDGDRLSDFDELFDVSLPPIGPYRLQGTFGSRPSGYYIDGLEVSIGDSLLNGSLSLDTANQPPRLRVDLVAETIQLDDFDTGEWSPAGQADAPDEEPSTEHQEGEKINGQGKQERALLTPEVLNALDAQATVKVEEVRSGYDRLGSGTVTTRLGEGRLEVSPLKLEVPGGTVDLSFALQPYDESIALQAKATMDQLDYGLLARRIDPESATGGKISVDVDLATHGPDMDRLMHHANGHIDFAVWPDDLNAEVFELWAVSVLSALMKEVDKDKQSRVHCVIASFALDDGLMQERVLFADTTRMRVEGTAEVDFKERTLRVRAGPRAKRPEFFSLAVPVGLRGRFDDYRFNINPIELTGQALSFITSPAHVPLRRIFKRGEPVDSETACATAWAQRNTD